MNQGNKITFQTFVWYIGGFVIFILPRYPILGTTETQAKRTNLFPLTFIKK